MSSSLATVREDLTAELAPLLPPAWRIVDSLSAAVRSLVPVLYFEFTGMRNTINGDRLPRGTVAADIDLVIQSVATDVEKAEAEIDASVLDLIHAIDGSDSIYWDTATKERLDSGQLVWRIPTNILTASTKE